ncbi:MAG TPA: hypothetical protein VGO21_04155, partial [Candidatus Paceibacterota bacterium]|nr:hypothetical protein [Candidatus Paceibacterota bacterium]
KPLVEATLLTSGDTHAFLLVRNEFDNDTGFRQFPNVDLAATRDFHEWLARVWDVSFPICYNHGDSRDINTF